MSEDSILELLALIRGGKWLGAKGITTYPNYPEERHRLLHDGCLELERRGLIRRQNETEKHVFWMPVEEAEGLLTPPAA